MTKLQIGTDELISLVDGWGPDDPHVPLHFNEWKVSQFDHPIGLLLGGIGDGKRSLIFSFVPSLFVHLWPLMWRRLARYLLPRRHPLVFSREPVTSRVYAHADNVRSSVIACGDMSRAHGRLPLPVYSRRFHSPAAIVYRACHFSGPPLASHVVRRLSPSNRGASNRQFISRRRRQVGI